MQPNVFFDLSENLKMPAIGLGTGQARDEVQLTAALNVALEVGYRHVDTAHRYGNEKIIGKVLNQWFASRKLKREDVFVTTKLPIQGVHPDRVEFFLKKSLENLQLDYVDLYLVHFPVGFKCDLDTEQVLNNEPEAKTNHGAIWKKMEEQVDAGRTKSIGLSNYNIAQIETVLKTARIKPVNLQIELHVYFQQKELVEFCREKGVTVVAYAPLGSPGTNHYGRRNEETMPNLLGDPVVNKIAKKHSKTPAQIVLKFLIQRGFAPIPKSIKSVRLEENIAVFDFILDDEDVQELIDLDRGEQGRMFRMKLYQGIETHPDYPFTKK